MVKRVDVSTRNLSGRLRAACRSLSSRLTFAKDCAVRRLLLILLTILTVAVLVVVLRQNEAALAELAHLDVSAQALKIGAFVLAGLVALGLFRRRFSDVLEAVLLWIVVALLLALGYTYRFELRDVGEEVLAEFIPGHAVSKGRTVEIARGSSGSFSVAMQINGARIPMVLDTGASSVVLTQEAAKAAGLPLEVLNYSVNVDTANGRARAAPVTLDRVSIGGITERAVPALIAQPGQLRASLLGMSFLNRLESWEVRGGRLVMRGYP
jgi:aspartyl protease family protein